MIQLRSLDFISFIKQGGRQMNPRNSCYQSQRQGADEAMSRIDASDRCGAIAPPMWLVLFTPHDNSRTHTA